jgi:hypothetical protein
MKRATLILALLLTTTSFAQSSDDELKSGGRVKADKPTVYLEYVCLDKQKVYMRMHNNTVWHISVDTDELYPPKTQIKLRNGVNTSAAPNDREISLHYRVEGWALPWECVEVPKVAYPDNGFANWIASQDSILFSVPAAYLRKDLQVIVRFNYEWEVTKQGYTISDPEHRVSFRGIDLSGTKSPACKN